MSKTVRRRSLRGERYVPFKCSHCPIKAYYGVLVEVHSMKGDPVCENCKKPLVAVIAVIW